MRSLTILRVNCNRMQTLEFAGLGTQWTVIVDDEQFSDHAKGAILGFVRTFEDRFSRFLLSSETNAFRHALPGTYEISEEFADLLRMADRLRVLTGGVYDPAVGGLLEHCGYRAAALGELPTVSPQDFVIHQWSLQENALLIIAGPIVFDLGGMGKGYCIDVVGKILKEHGYRYFLVDGGGDILATEKRDGSAWRIAIEYPGKPDTAAGVVELRHQGLAVSDSYRRRFGKWHHLMDAQAKRSVDSLVGCAAVASTAWAADCMTSGLFFAKPEQFPDVAREFSARYMVFRNDGTAIVSSDWSGAIF